MSKRSIQFIVLLIILSAFLFFRFYNLDKRISFGWDQEQFANQVKQVIIFHKPLLIGPRALSDKGFFLGPYFDYILIPFFLITNLHPIAYYLFIIGYNILFFATSYFVLKKIFSAYHSLIFLAFWTINPLTARYDSIAWNPIFIPLGVLLVWYLLNKIYEKKTPLLYVLLGVTMGIFVNMHVQFVIIVIFVLIFLYLNQTKKIDKAGLTLLTISFLMTFTPILIFDIRHHFLNILSLSAFILKGADNSIALPFSWIPVFINIISPLIFFTKYLWMVYFYIAVLGTLLFLARDKKGFWKLFYSASIAVWLIFPLFFTKFGRRPSEYYFLFLYPFIYIAIADLLTKLNKIYLTSTIVLLLLILNYHSLTGNLKPDIRSLYYEDRVVKSLSARMNNKKFNISFTTPPGGDSGFRYLIDYYHINQTGNWKDPLVQIKWPCDQTCDINYGFIGAIIPPELK